MIVGGKYLADRRSEINIRYCEFVEKETLFFNIF